MSLADSRQRCGEDFEALGASQSFIALTFHGVAPCLVLCLAQDRWCSKEPRPAGLSARSAYAGEVKDFRIQSEK